MPFKINVSGKVKQKQKQKPKKKEREKKGNKKPSKIGVDLTSEELKLS